MPKMTDVEIDKRFHYQPPTTDSRRNKHAQVTAATIQLARLLRDYCPEGRGFATAMTKLEECRMWANQSIACDSPTED